MNTEDGSTPSSALARPNPGATGSEETTPADVASGEAHGAETLDDADSGAMKPPSTADFVAQDIPRSGIGICDQIVDKVEKCIQEIDSVEVRSELRPLLAEDAGAWAQTVAGGGAASSVEIGCRSARGIWRERLMPHGCWRDDVVAPGKLNKRGK